MKQAFEDIVDRFRGSIPSSTLCGDLTGCKDIISVREYVYELLGGTKQTLESELVWPVPKPILI